ncbi:hypothetical protein YC2023_030672 [Brassica napus]
MLKLRGLHKQCLHLMKACSPLLCDYVTRTVRESSRSPMSHRFTLKCQIFTFYRIYLSTKESPSMIKVTIFMYYIVKSVKIQWFPII